MYDDSCGKKCTSELGGPFVGLVWRMSREALNEEERDLARRDGVCKGPRCVECSLFEGQKDG